MKDIPVEIQLNHVTFQLKERHNFDWLIKLGTVFAVLTNKIQVIFLLAWKKMVIRNLLNMQGHKPLHMKEQRVMLLKG